MNESKAPMGRRGGKDKFLYRNKPTNIKGRHYTGHALDKMQEQGITPTVVESTINNGIEYPGNTADTSAFYNKDTDITVIINNLGYVITVMHGLATYLEKFIK